MKKKEVVRDYNFSDGRLVTIVNEKIAYIRRDEAQFDSYGIKADMVDALERQTNEFSDTATDVELVADQTEVTAAKDVIVANLQVAIRGVMSRVVLKYPVESAKYRKFGTEALSKQSPERLPELHISILLFQMPHPNEKPGFSVQKNLPFAPLPLPLKSLKIHKASCFPLLCSQTQTPEMGFPESVETQPLYRPTSLQNS